MIKAVGFDIGHTLINYDNPLNLSSLYKPAFKRIFSVLNLDDNEKKLQDAVAVLTKYNTRINYRETEISSDSIFSEILTAWNENRSILNEVKNLFFSFIQTDASPFQETETVLAELKAQKIEIGVLTNVAYGMDNPYSLKDIDPLIQYIDIALTSVDIGFRKPNAVCFQKLLDSLQVNAKEMLYVGDEDVDIIGAKKLGIGSVLINRGNRILNYGQDYTIKSLNDLFNIVSGK